jgi:hypothetical protein
MRLRYLLSGRRIMMQQTFGQPYDADIDRSHDGGLPVQRRTNSVLPPPISSARTSVMSPGKPE